MIALAAISKNLIIGKDGKLPFRSKEDLQFFKETTMNGNIVVGRTTFKGLPFLPNRTIWVMSKTKVQTALYGADFKWHLIHNIEQAPADSFLCGGANIYKQFLPSCSSLLLTELDFDAEGDTMFPYTKKEIGEMFPNVELIKTIENGTIKRYYKNEQL